MTHPFTYVFISEVLPINRYAIAVITTLLFALLVGCSPTSTGNERPQTIPQNETPPKSVQDVSNLEEKREQATRALDEKFANMPWYPLVEGVEFSGNDLHVQTTITEELAAGNEPQQICFAIFAHYHGDRNPLLEQVIVIDGEGNTVFSCPES